LALIEIVITILWQVPNIKQLHLRIKVWKMKKLYLILLLFIGMQGTAQEAKKLVPILISAQGKTVDAFLDSNNSKKILMLAKQDDANAKLLIMNANAKNESSYNRSFSLVDDKDAELKLSFMSRVVGNTYVSLKNFFEQAQKGKTYKLYTIAIPKDPNVAATVRVRRILLCNVTVK
jgi:hypothetical protein